MSSALIPLLSPAFPFFESVNGSLHLFYHELWNFFRLFHTGILIYFYLFQSLSSAYSLL